MRGGMPVRGGMPGDHITCLEMRTTGLAALLLGWFGRGTVALRKPEIPACAGMTMQGPGWRVQGAGVTGTGAGVMMRGRLPGAGGGAMAEVEAPNWERGRVGGYSQLARIYAVSKTASSWQYRLAGVVDSGAGAVMMGAPDAPGSEPS